MSELDGLKLLRRIEQGVAGKTGEAFFRQIIRDLCESLGAHAGFTSRLLPDKRAGMLAFWCGGSYQPLLEYSLAGTPCEFVYAGRITSYARDIGSTFPIDRAWFEELGVNSYLGIPVVGENGVVCGHLAVMDTQERDWREADVDILRLFSLRAAAELERLMHQTSLEQAYQSLQESNRQLQREIAHRLEVEEQLDEARVAAESANQAKSIFISNMSHELRTPLNGILGYAQLLQADRSKLTPIQQKGLGVIEQSGEHLLTLVNDLLDLAKIEAGRFDIRHERVALDELLQHVVDVLQVRARSAQLSFTFNADADLPENIISDTRALRQILLNLLNNAVKFTPAGGAVSLRVSCEPVTARRVRLQVEVEDSGVGIPAEELGQVFKPFYRITRSADAVEGTGLGLSITQRLINMLGGDLQVSSEVGKGSLFKVTLETQRAASSRRRVLRKGEIVGYEGPRRSVLIVDDDPVNLDLVQELLGSLGFVTRTASNGRMALESAEELVPDLLVTDLVMPELNGLQLVRELRAHPALRAVPVIALSASASDHDRQDALDGGCDAFLSKPVHYAQLLEELGKRLALNWRCTSLPRQSAIVRRRKVEDSYRLEPGLGTELYDLAMRGDVYALLARMDATLATDANATALHTELASLARNYDLEAIRRTLSERTNMAQAG